MITVDGYCDRCARAHEELVDGWLVACDAYPDGIPTKFFLSGDDRTVCNNGIGFEEKTKPIEEQEPILV